MGNLSSSGFKRIENLMNFACKKRDKKTNGTTHQLSV